MKVILCKNMQKAVLKTGVHSTEHGEMIGISLISYGHQWILKIVLMIIILIAIVIGIVIGIKIWRKRK